MFPRIRNFALVAAILVTIYFLLQSFHVGPRDIDHSTRQSLQAISKFAPDSWRSHPPAVTKVTALFDQANELYEAAVRSHEEHDRANGYDLKILRARIVDNYTSKPTYLLSLLVEQLSKPEEERTEWLMWFGPDVVLLNPHIPLEIFLPPQDFDHVNFLGTHDHTGLNCGVFFLRVDEWSVRMLIEVLGVPHYIPQLTEAEDKGKMAFEMILTSDQFRDHVYYQPRGWYNAYQRGKDDFEGRPGQMIVHYHDMNGDKWTAMADRLAEVQQGDSRWDVALEETTYGREVDEYWNRLRRAQELMNQADKRREDEAIDGALRRMGYTFNYEADREDVMDKAIESMEEVLGLRKTD